MSGNICKDTLETKDFIYTAYRNLLEGNKGWTYSRKNKKTGEKIKLSKKVFNSEIKEARDDYKKKKMGEQIETKQGINKNRTVDSLDDLDREFCKTFDKLLALYKRIMIRAYTLKEERGAKK